MLHALFEAGNALERRYEILHVLGRALLVAAHLDDPLDREQGLPAAEHVGIGGEIPVVVDTVAVVGETDLFPIEFFELRRVAFAVAGHGLPEIAALEVLEARAGNVHRLDRVDEAEELGPVGAEVLAHFPHEGENAGAHHDVIDQVGVRGDLREVAREGGLGRRHRNKGIDLAPVLSRRFAEVVAMIIAEGVVGKDHRDLLAKVGDPFAHGRDLRFHVRDAWLKYVPGHLAGRKRRRLAAQKVGHLQLVGDRPRAMHHMLEQAAEHEIHVVPGNQLAADLAAALGVGAVVLDHEIDRPAVDAARCIDHLDCGLRCPVVPAAVCRADAGQMNLQADLDGFVRAGGPGLPGNRAEHRAANDAGRRCALDKRSPADRHLSLPVSLY